MNNIFLSVRKAVFMSAIWLAMTTDVSAQFAGGTGTGNDPYQIATAAQLDTLARRVNAGDTAYNNKHYILTADINLGVAPYNTGIGWIPIGDTIGHQFKGTFDGNEHTISNLYINDTARDYAGLFGYVNGGNIKNVGIVDADITGRDEVGGLVGDCFGCSMANCYITGLVRGDFDIGGIAGSFTSGSIKNCYSVVEVSAASYRAGGIAGTFHGSSMSYCYTIGAVSGNSHVGGIVGVPMFGASVTNCLALNAWVKQKNSDASYICGRIRGSSSAGYVNFDNNYAFDSMRNNAGNTIWNNKGLDILDGEDISKEFINTDSTLGGLFADASVWTTAKGKLPGLFGRAVDMPAHLQISHPALGGGTGDSLTPYLIFDSLQLKALADYVNAGNGDSTTGKYYQLMNDIDLGAYAGGEGWKPIGYVIEDENVICPFYGNFEGNGYVVKNMTVNRPAEEYVGLFGVLWDATVQNLAVEDCHVEGYGSVGALAGVSFNSTVTNSYSTGNINGDNSVGGLVGINSMGSILANSYSTVIVNGNRSVGGLTGLILVSTIINCYATGDVSGDGAIGGLVGDNQGASTIKYCYATGTVTGNYWVGGLIAVSSTSTISNCIAANDSVISMGQTAYINRIAARSEDDTLQNNYALGAMVVRNNGAEEDITDGTDVAGTAKDMVTLQSLAFYTATGNWDEGIWDITGASGIWEICGGYGFPFLRWQGITCLIPVTDITGIPTGTKTGVPLPLTGTVVPGNATNQSIHWSVKNAGTTGASISNNTLITTAAGTATITATIADGLGTGTNYTKDFSVTISNGVGITETVKERMVIYPNPVTNGKLRIESEEWFKIKNEELRMKDETTIQLFDFTGKLVAVYPITGETTEIDISYLSDGVYLVKAGNTISKVIKQ